MAQHTQFLPQIAHRILWVSLLTSAMAATDNTQPDAEGVVYTLQLEGDNYYAGWTTNLENRIAQHFLGLGSQWTKLHPPLQVMSCLPGNALLENATTIALMCRHGWSRVRGGPWHHPDLPAAPDALRYAIRCKHFTSKRSFSDITSGTVDCRSVENLCQSATSQSEVQQRLPFSGDSGLGEEIQESLPTHSLDKAVEFFSVNTSWVEIWQTKTDGLPNAWRAKITGPKADQECGVRRFKMIYANTRNEVTRKVRAWAAHS